MDALRDFYEVMGACGLARPEWQAWQAWASDNADLWPIVKNGEVIGGVFFKGQTVHIAIRPDWQGRWLTPSMIRAYKTWAHECEIVAHPPKDNEAACQLAQRLGFKFRAPHNEFNVYVKEPTCPQPS
jgi:RimJ/RimL family protein N-acetyltransferase